MKLMLDSGAYSLYTKHCMKQNPDGSDNYDFYRTREFWDYVDSYCEFLKTNKDTFDVYVSVDVLFNPDMSWEVHKYMEDVHKLRPIPVFHAGEDFKWLRMYIDNYEYIGMQGLGKMVKKMQWIMKIGAPAWGMICDDKGMPRNKVHGFAMTSPDLIIEFPYYSVDSTSWLQFGKYGLIIIPKKKNGKFIYEESPHIISVSARKKKKTEYDHFEHLPTIDQKHIMEYLEMKGIPMGKSILEDEEFDRSKPELPISKKSVSSVERIIEVGVCNNNDLRDQLNLDYYLDLESAIPPWPRPWRKKKNMVTRLPL